MTEEYTHTYLNVSETQAPAIIPEEFQIKQILNWIGFGTRQLELIYNDSITEFKDLMTMAESDIKDIADDYSARPRTGNNPQNIQFGMRRIKKLKALVHWTQDFARINKMPTIQNMTGREFQSQLDRASERAKVRKALVDQSETSSKEASPGELKSEKQWIEWETKFHNFLSCLIGVAGVPLSYVTREKEQPDNGSTYDTFIEETIACAPLSGTFYDADKATVHQHVLSFTTGHPSEDWIKNVARHRDGRKDINALRNHFAGEGNASRRIAEAERLRDTLHYKNERAMLYEIFLSKTQKMFNIFREQGEEKTEDEMIRFLLSKTQHRDLQSAVEALRTQITMGNNITYTTAANHLSAAVSNLPEFNLRNRSISNVQVSSNNDGIYNADGSIKTGHISNWSQLSLDDKKKVFEERKRLGTKYVPSGSGGGKNKSIINNDSKLKKLNKRYKRQIKALKRKARLDDEDNDNGGASQDGAQSIDAGDQFGGKRQAAAGKKTKS